MLDPAGPWWCYLGDGMGRFSSLLVSPPSLRWWRTPSAAQTRSTHVISGQAGRWFLNAAGALAAGRHTILGLEFLESVRVAAQANVRVVLGERDLATTMRR